MRNAINKTFVIGSALAMVWTGAARAEEKPAAGQSPEAMMAEWAKLNQPAEQHAVLKKMVGKFTAEAKMKMAADAPEMVSKGEETNEMILDGRFLQSTYSGDMMGMPFRGVGMMGYDTVKKKFTTYWMDNSSTGAMFLEGTADASGKVITFTGQMPCPMKNNEMVPMRQVMTLIDDNHMRFEMFSPGPDGKEFRGFVIEYTRAK
jgi:hypothetical protein